MTTSKKEPSLESFLEGCRKLCASDAAIDLNAATHFFKAWPQPPPNSFLKVDGLIVKKLAILTGYTIRPLVPLIRAYALRLGVWLDIYDCEYGRYASIIAERDPQLHDFKPDLCYFNVGTEHVQFSNLDSETIRWTRLFRAAGEWLNCDVVFNSFIPPEYRAYGNLEAKFERSQTRFVEGLNAALAEQALGSQHIFDIKALSARFGSLNWRDEKLYDISKIPVAFSHWRDFAIQLAGLIGAACGRNRKCLVLDLDNTLWGGVIGEDGVAGIQIGADGGAGEAYLRFQHYIKQLKARGLLLAVCTKNDLQTAQEPFLNHPEMPLKLSDISYFVANWDRKDKNIVQIATQLNIGLDSLVFVDNDPAEREIVRQNLPEVAVIDLPNDPSDYTRALSGFAGFETLLITDEDLSRTEYLRSTIQQRERENSFGSYQEYLASLEMKAVVEKVDAVNLPRATQLINKTNQFNLRTQRYTEAELTKAISNSQVLSLYVRLSDRFGDHGLISVVIARIEGQVMRIETWVMSCRVLKRDVEALVMKEIVREAQKQGMNAIRGEYIATAKNAVVADFFAGFGFVNRAESTEGSTLWELNLEGPQVTEILKRPVPILINRVM